MQGWDDEWDESDHELDARAREWGPHAAFGTEDAARLGLDRHTLEGAQLAFFAHLDPAKLSHRLTAVVALLVLVGVPVLLTLGQIFHG